MTPSNPNYTLTLPQALVRELTGTGRITPPRYAVGQRWWGKWDNSSLWEIVGGNEVEGFVFESLKTGRKEHGVYQDKNWLYYHPNNAEIIKLMEEAFFE